MGKKKDKKRKKDKANGAHEPTSTDVQNFKNILDFDIDAKLEEKINKLIDKHGLEAYYIASNEMVRRRINEMLESEDKGLMQESDTRRRRRRR